MQTSETIIKIDLSFGGSPLLMYRLAFLPSSPSIAKPCNGMARAAKVCIKRRLTSLTSQLIPGGRSGESHRSKKSEPCVNEYEGEVNDYRTRHVGARGSLTNT
jgi:hypothetical protein